MRLDPSFGTSRSGNAVESEWKGSPATAPRHAGFRRGAPVFAHAGQRSPACHARRAALGLRRQPQARPSLCQSSVGIWLRRGRHAALRAGGSVRGAIRVGDPERPADVSLRSRGIRPATRADGTGLPLGRVGCPQRATAAPQTLLRRAVLSVLPAAFRPPAAIHAGWLGGSRGQFRAGGCRGDRRRAPLLAHCGRSRPALDDRDGGHFPFPAAGGAER